MRLVAGGARFADAAMRWGRSPATGGGIGGRGRGNARRGEMAFGAGNRVGRWPMGLVAGDALGADHAVRRLRGDRSVRGCWSGRIVRGERVTLAAEGWIGQGTMRLVTGGALTADTSVLRGWGETLGHVRAHVCGAGVLRNRAVAPHAVGRIDGGAVRLVTDRALLPDRLMLWGRMKGHLSPLFVAGCARGGRGPGRVLLMRFVAEAARSPVRVGVHVEMIQHPPHLVARQTLIQAWREFVCGRITVRGQWHLEGVLVAGNAMQGGLRGHGTDPDRAVGVTAGLGAGLIDRNELVDLLRVTGHALHARERRRVGLEVRPMPGRRRDLRPVSGPVLVDVTPLADRVGDRGMLAHSRRTLGDPEVQLFHRGRRGLRVAFVAVEVAMPASGEPHERVFHDVTPGTEPVVVLHVRPPDAADGRAADQECD